MHWLIKLAQTDIINISYLTRKGMSPAQVSGEIVQSLDAINTDYFKIPPGTLGVLIEAEKGFVVALSMGIFGFAPFDTMPNLWQRTNQQFNGSPEDLKNMQKESVGAIDLTTVPEIVQLRTHPDVTESSIDSDNAEIVFFEKPKGPRGYRSPYRLLIRNEMSGLIRLTVVIRGETRTLKSDKDNLGSLIQSAILLLQMEHKS